MLDEMTKWNAFQSYLWKRKLTFVESWADNRWTRSCSSSNSRRNRCSSEMSELGSWSFTPPPGKENTNWFIFSAKITQCIVSDIYLSLVLLLFSRKKKSWENAFNLLCPHNIYELVRRANTLLNCLSSIHICWIELFVNQYCF